MVENDKTHIYIDLSDYKPGRKGIEFISLIMLSFLLRIIYLGKESLWLDEVYSVLYVTERYTLSGILFNLPLTDPHPPFYYVILDFWVKIFGHSEFAVRFPSAIFGTLAVVSLYLLGRELFNHYTGIISALMMSISSFHIYYSQSTRMYSLLGFLSTFSLYSMVKLLEDNNRRQKAVYIVSTVLLGYTHAFGLFTILIQNMYISILKFSDILGNPLHRTRENRDKLKLLSWIKIQSLLGILVSPWIFVLIYRALGKGNGLARISWITLPELSDFINALTSYLIYNRPNLAKYGLNNLELFINNLSFVIVVIGVFSIFYNLKKEEFSFKPENNTVLPALILFTPLLGAFIISYTITPIFKIRYTLSGSIGLYLLLGNLLESMYNSKTSDKAKTWLFFTLSILIITIMTINLPLLYLEDQNEQWDEVTNDIKSLSDPEDLVIISAHHMINPYNYYKEDSMPEGNEILERNPSKTVNELMRDRQYSWLILSQVDESKFVEKLNSSKLAVNKIGDYEKIGLYKITKGNVSMYT